MDLKEFLSKKRMGMQTFAERICYDKNYIYKILRGQCNVTEKLRRMTQKEFPEITEWPDRFECVPAKNSKKKKEESE